VHNSTVYQNADTGFFDDTGSHYNSGAASKAWKETLDWLNRYLRPAPAQSGAPPLPSKGSNAGPARLSTVGKASTAPKAPTVP
jgi:hypothetical protein